MLEVPGCSKHGPIQIMMPLHSQSPQIQGTYLFIARKFSLDAVVGMRITVKIFTGISGNALLGGGGGNSGSVKSGYETEGGYIGSVGGGCLGHSSRKEYNDEACLRQVRDFVGVVGRMISSKDLRIESGNLLPICRASKRTQSISM